VIYDKFRKFGNIIKLLIFEKNEVTKFFIEFAEVDQAVNVPLPPRRPKRTSTAPNSAAPSAK
jgi:hypothetical protein